MFDADWKEEVEDSVSGYFSNGAWDMHIRKLLDNGRKKVNQLHKVIIFI